MREARVLTAAAEEKLKLRRRRFTCGATTPERDFAADLNLAGFVQQPVLLVLFAPSLKEGLEMLPYLAGTVVSGWDPIGHSALNS